MSALRDAWSELGRRKLRHALTVLGIGIGVAALLLLGALSEKLSRLVLGGRDFAAGQITVSSAGSRNVADVGRGGLLSGDQLLALERVDGVRAVAPIVMFPLEENPGSLPFTLAPLVFGVDMAMLALNEVAPPPVVRLGRGLPAAGGGEVVIGSQVAHTYGVGVGSTLAVRGRDFTVIGVLETTFTGPDSFVFMPFPVAARLLVDSEPLLRRLVMMPGASVLPIATAAAVFWRDGTDPERVTERIRAALPDVSVTTPAEAAAQIDRSLLFLNAVILGSGLTALLVASLAVASTMVTAVVERRREIGLRRVVGATRGQVVAQLVVEAGLLGLLGGVLGVVGGWAAVTALNGVTLRLGAPVFLITTRLVIGALLLPVVLAGAAGVWPALRAARLAPTDALRWT
jgi:putative ABC transport system permease protein